MKKTTISAALLAASMIASPAWAGDTEGHWQIKVLGTGVLPDGKIDKINSVAPAVATALGATPGTTANDNWVPTLAVEYFATPNVSIETICCFTQHHVTGTGSIAGADIAQHVLALPATMPGQSNPTSASGRACSSISTRSRGRRPSRWVPPS